MLIGLCEGVKVNVSRGDDGDMRLWVGNFMLKLDDDIVAEYIPWADEERHD